MKKTVLILLLASPILLLAQAKKDFVHKFSSHAFSR